MVRFIIPSLGLPKYKSLTFTFQYGQIYYYYDIDKDRDTKSNLHSNMVRFIIFSETHTNSAPVIFTFQYGQIYYGFTYRHNRRVIVIYIPIWLDLLFYSNDYYVFHFLCDNLHSNMVRFIMGLNCLQQYCGRQFTFQYGQIYYSIPMIIMFFISFATIYIPIWLDLLFFNFVRVIA